MKVELNLVKQDWKNLFKEREQGRLQLFEPVRVDGKIVVKPLVEDVEEGIARWKSSLVG
jgi:hypothetical protein